MPTAGSGIGAARVRTSLHVFLRKSRKQPPRMPTSTARHSYARRVPFSEWKYPKPGNVPHQQLRGVPEFEYWRIPSHVLPAFPSGRELMGRVTIAFDRPRTCTIAIQLADYWPKERQNTPKFRYVEAVDETLSVVEGDLVYLQKVPGVDDRVQYVVGHIIQPNIEGRLRMNMGLSAIPPPEKPLPVALHDRKPPVGEGTSTDRKLRPILRAHTTEVRQIQQSLLGSGVNMGWVGDLTESRNTKQKNWMSKEKWTLHLRALRSEAIKVRAHAQAQSKLISSSALSAAQGNAPQKENPEPTLVKP